MTDWNEYDQPPQYPHQRYGQQYPQDQLWRPRQEESWEQSSDLQQGYLPRGARQQPKYREPPFPPQQPGYRPPRSPRRKSWPVRHKVLTGLMAFASLIIIGGIARASGGSHANAGAGIAVASREATVRPSSATGPRSSAKPHATAVAEAACDHRGFASGDIDVRMLSPGIQWTAQQLGGEWVWDYALSKCLTSVQMMIATAPMVPGSCTQVGYVADNPGYDANANVAAPLEDVAAQAGPAC